MRDEAAIRARVVGIDPGGTTGLCRFEGKHLEVCEQFDLFELGDWLSTELAPEDILVVEAYKLRASSAKTMIGNTFPAPEAIGLIKYWAHTKGKGIHWQSPAQKEYFSNERLQLLGLYQRGMPHANDSIRHALYYQSFGLNMSDWLMLISQKNQETETQF